MRFVALMSVMAAEGRSEAYLGVAGWSIGLARQGVEGRCGQARWFWQSSSLLLVAGGGQEAADSRLRAGRVVNCPRFELRGSAAQYLAIGFSGSSGS